MRRKDKRGWHVSSQSHPIMMQMDDLAQRMTNTLSGEHNRGWDCLALLDVATQRVFVFLRRR